MNRSRHFIASAIFLFSTVSCAEQQNPMQALDLQNAHGIQLMSSQTLTVVDENGRPIPNAEILLGYESGNPFPGNQLSTDASGVVNVPADWKAALPLTVMAPGYVTSTVPTATPGDQTLKLSKQEPPNDLEIKGVPEGYGRLVTDGKVDFALMIPAITRSQLLAFDLATVLSPQTDVISILGNDVNLPSNIALPQQWENYIFSVEFNKPDFRLYVRNPGQYSVSAIHGQFPLQRVVGEIRAGKSIFDLINYFNFLESGKRDVIVTQNITGADLPVNEVPFNGTPINVKAPAFAAGQVMVGLSVVDENGLLRPTDMKRFLPNQTMALKTDGAPAKMTLSLLLPDSNALAATASTLNFLQPLVNLEPSPLIKIDSAQRKPQDWTVMSFALNTVGAGAVTPQFLPLVERPKLNGQVLTMQAPPLPADLNATATYLVLSEVEVTMNGNVRNERKTRLWEIWTNGWLNQFELPKIAINRRSDRVYRWEVMFMARPANLVDAGAAAPRLDLNTVTHVTRSALDF